MTKAVKCACDEAGLAAAAACLNSGGVALVPTDTVYGIAAHPGFPGAVARLYAIKGRDGGKPIAALVEGPDAARRLLRAEGAAFDALAAHWPGALTVVANGEGARVPDHDWMRRLAGECGGALRVTSANESGAGDCAGFEAAFAAVGRAVDVAVDGGTCAGGRASTVARLLDGGSFEILRQGGVVLAEEGK